VKLPPVPPSPPPATDKSFAGQLPAKRKSVEVKDDKSANKKARVLPETAIPAAPASDPGAAAAAEAVTGPPFVCPTCRKVFPLLWRLRAHETGHEAARKFACTHTACTEAFRTAGQLALHRASHEAISTAAPAATTSKTAASSSSNDSSSSSDDNSEEEPKKRSQPKGRKQAVADDTSDYEEAAASSTRNARSSGGRELRARKPVSYVSEEVPEAHAFIEPIWFVSEHAQPFRVEVDPCVHVLLDIHSHLMHTEVIGLLGGLWDPSRKLLRILTAHPCRTLGTGNDHFNVEMDPVSQIEVSERITAAGQITIGWYHSHPVFANDPSTIDVQNQMTYQSFYSQADCTGHASSSSAHALPPLRPVDGMVPFVAAIITCQ
jgi:hypothetical protein